MSDVFNTDTASSALSAEAVLNAMKIDSRHRPLEIDFMKPIPMMFLFGHKSLRKEIKNYKWKKDLIPHKPKKDIDIIWIDEA